MAINKYNKIKTDTNSAEELLLRWNLNNKEKQNIDTIITKWIYVSWFIYILREVNSDPENLYVVVLWDFCYEVVAVCSLVCNFWMS